MALHVKSSKGAFGAPIQGFLLQTLPHALEKLRFGMGQGTKITLLELAQIHTEIPRS
jgi:hypothetical protein